MTKEIEDEVFGVVSGLGTPTHRAVVDQLNQKEVPDLFVSSGSLQWGDDVENRPMTFGWQPDYESEGKIIIGDLEAGNCETELPSRLNVALGGSPRCRDDALVNEVEARGDLDPEDAPAAKLARATARIAATSDTPRLDAERGRRPLAAHPRPPGVAGEPAERAVDRLRPVKEAGVACGVGLWDALAACEFDAADESHRPDWMRQSRR